MISIDSTAVNTVMAKLDSMVAKVAPKLEEGGMAFVDYKVSLFTYDTILWMALPLLLVSICILIVYLVFRSTDSKKDDDLRMSISVLCFLVGLVAFIAFICHAVDIGKLIIAIRHPVIYTILELTGK